jgi:predicted RNA-binding protein Jag
MNKIENDFVIFWVEEGILFSKYKKDVVLDLETVTELIEMREKISVQENQYWLYDLTRVKNNTNEARHYVGEHGHNFLNACAIIVDSYVTKFMFTSYKKFKSPDFPFASFTNREEALQWLFEIKANNEAVSSF